MRIIVLGAGLVGAPMATDLANEGRFEVTVADFSEDALNLAKTKCPQLSVVRRDLSDPKEVTALVGGYDLAINAVPGYMGFETAKAIIEAGKNSVCIAFYEEDPFELDQLAKEKGVSMIMDCGVSPGLGSILVMHAAQKLDEVDSVTICVGGLPEIREWPSEYKAVFSPLDVIELYTRPVRLIQHGIEIVRPALSDPEHVYFPEIGTLEAFNTDGLRTLTKTLNAPNMVEKTLRYPGHIQKMALLRELGFFSKEKNIEIDGVRTSPLDLTVQVLLPSWKMKPGERDITVFRSIVEGKVDGRKMRISYDMVDRYSPETGMTSMARTTGYTATLALRMIADGFYTHKGISPPEYIGKHPDCVEYLRRGLEERGVVYRETIEEID